MSSASRRSSHLAERIEVRISTDADPEVDAEGLTPTLRCIVDFWRRNAERLAEERREHS